MLQNSKSSLNTQKPKKQFKKKVIIYLFLISILTLLFVLGYFKFSKYLTTPFKVSNTILPSGINNDNVVPESITEESKSFNLLNEVLQKQIEFQQEVTQRIFDLEKEVKSNINTNERSLLLSKIASLEQQICLLSNKKDYIKNFTIIYNFILALKGNTPFLVELDSFNSTFLVQSYTHEIEVLSAVANKGIPNNYDLAYAFDSLFPQIKTAIYQLDKSTWGKIKYYISYIFVTQKYKDFSVGDNSIDSIAYDIKTALFNNSPEKALAIVESNNLQRLNILAGWWENLNYRVKANILASKLQQYLISINGGK